MKIRDCVCDKYMINKLEENENYSLYAVNFNQINVKRRYFIINNLINKHFVRQSLVQARSLIKSWFK